jgi:YidC/Oxa1 family membrane protein insertase
VKSDTLRTIIGFSLIVIILVGWQVLYKPKPRAAATPPVTEPAEVAPETTAAEPPKPVAPPALAPIVPGAAGPESTVALENDVMRLELSSYGGTVKSAWLKKFDADMIPSGTPLLGTTVLVAGGALDVSSTPMQVTADESSATFTVKDDSLTITKT